MSGLFWLASRARNAAYDSGALASARLPLPALGVGNLAVGGTGKTPLASWLAQELAARGARPGILLRGYGDDEALEHRSAVPEAVVVTGPDRRAAADAAAAGGACALVLDDCLQRRSVAVDAMLTVVAAETWTEWRWPLPAGPWREGLPALARSDLVAVTCRTAPVEQAAALAGRLGRLTRLGKGVVFELVIADLRPLSGGNRLPLTMLDGRRVLALCGIGEPELFATQLRRLGARVELMDLDDHHVYTAADVREAGRRISADSCAVTTAKDAVKLSALWPADGPPCFVAGLEVRPAYGSDVVGAVLDATAEAARVTLNPKNS